MEAYPRTTTWPYLLIVVALILSATSAPRTWFEFDAPSASRTKRPQTGGPKREQSEAVAGRAPGLRASRGIDRSRVASSEPADQVNSTLDAPYLPRPAAVVAQRGVRLEHSPRGPRTSSASDRTSDTSGLPVLVDRASGEAEGLAPSVPIAVPAAALDSSHVTHIGGPILSSLPATRPAAAEISGSADVLDLPLLFVAASDPPARSAAPADRPEGPRVSLPVWPDRFATRFPSLAPRDDASGASNDAGDWPACHALRLELEALSADELPDPLRQWVHQTRQQIDQLRTAGPLSSATTYQILTDLRASCQSVERGEWESQVPEDQAARVRVALYAVLRRLDVWQHVATASQQRQAANIAAISTSDLVPVLADLEHLLQSHPNGNGWRTYLLLDRLNDVALATWRMDTHQLCDLAYQLDRRLDADILDEAQQSFAARDEVQKLPVTLHRVAAAAIDLRQLLEQVEEFELREAAGTGQQVGLAAWVLARSPLEADRAVGESIARHYRNANMRLVLSAGLANRMLPALDPIVEPVQDTILGAWVQGRNATWTSLGLRFVPDEDRLHLRLIATGETRSRTMSTKGPVRLYNRGDSTFHADKEIAFASDGIWVGQAQSFADSRSRLLNIESDFDHLPFLGWVIRQLAANQLHEQRGALRRELRQRIASSARQRLDESIDRRLIGVQGRFEQKLLEPLRRLELEPQTLEMRTTSDRVTLRCRLSSPIQMAAFTARPRADSASVFSLQVHQSAVNNILNQTGLEGRQIDADQLIERLHQQFGIERAEWHDELPEGVQIRLADEEPISFEFDRDRVQLSVHIARLVTPDRSWRDFVVRGRYWAAIDRQHVDLHRDGGIELISPELGLRDQIALRGIFTKVLRRNQRLEILRGRLENDPRLAQLAVTQFVARDGWIGMSVGQGQRMAEESTPLRK